LGRTPSSRKQRLFAATCCRRAWHQLAAEGLRQTLLEIERLADEAAGQQPEAAQRKQWASARQPALAWLRAGGCFASAGLLTAYYAVIGAASATSRVAAKEASKFAARTLGIAARGSAGRTGDAWRSGRGAPTHAAERQAQAAALRDIFGNPFRHPPAIDPAWLAWQGGTVAQLAQAAYTERTLPEGTLDPTRLALVADALEDAGCTDAELLGHLRGPGPHVRGCWALDLVLGKS
jgi:hypothetical protein